MHIHLPKPLHGWREFVGEVGIIVLGVLIALGFEQLVERAHWHHKVEQATETLRDTMAEYSVYAIEEQVTAPCIDRQLTLLEQRLTAPGRFQPIALRTDRAGVPFSIRTPSRPWGDNSWRIVGSEGVASHLDAGLRRTMEHIFDGADAIRQNAQEVDAILWRLNGLSQPVALDDAARFRAIEEIEEVRGRVALTTLYARRILDWITEAKMLAPRRDLQAFIDSESGTAAFCRAQRLPLGRIGPA